MAATYVGTADAGFTTVGAGFATTGPGSYSTTEYYCPGGGTGANTARFVFTGLTASTAYIPALTWVPFSNRSTAVPWTVYDGSFPTGTLPGTHLATGTINQQSAPSGPSGTGPAGTAEFTYLTASVTPTGTSLTIVISDTFAGSGSYMIADAARLQLATDPTVCGTIANGNWASSGTWAAGIIPGSGSVASISNDVTVTANTTVGDGTASTVLSVGTSGAGSLTVTGASLTIQGNTSVGQSGTQGTWITLQNSGTTGGGLIFNSNSGVRPTMTFADDALIDIAGASNGRCYVRTMATAAGDGSNSAGLNAVLVNGGTSRSFYMTAAYCDFYGLGDSSTAGISAVQVNDSGSLANPPFTLSNCTFNACGTAPNVNVGGATVNLSWSGTTWENQAGSNAFDVNASSNSLTTGTRTISGCVLNGTASIDGCIDLTISGCVFNGGPTIVNRTYNWTSFDGNLVLNTADGSPTGATNIAGDATNNYFLSMPTVTPSSFPNGVLLGYYSLQFTGNVFEYVGTYSSFAQQGTWVRTSDGPGRNVVYTVEFNIALGWGSPLGSSGSPFVDVINDPANSPFTVTSTLEHNTACVGQNGAASIRAQSRIDSVNSLKANIFWSASGPQGYGAYDTNSPLITDVIPASVVTNNCWHGLATAGSGSAAGGTIAQGTVYDTPMSGSTAPGANDAAATDPQFADKTRNIAAWDLSLGGAGTVASALSRIQATPTLTKSSLIPYIRSGYVPTNSVIEFGSYVGDPSTTDAAGNPWPGSPPTIGAMAFATPTPTPTPTANPAALLMGM